MNKDASFDILISLSYPGYAKFSELNYKAIEPDMKKLIAKITKKFLS